jgi:site-specific recombinase XerD
MEEEKFSPSAIQKRLKSEASDVHRWLVLYEDYLLKVRGLCWNSRRVYVRIAMKFVIHMEESGTVEWQNLNAEKIVGFVLSETRDRKGKGVTAVTSCVRSFLRFLVSKGIVRAGLELAIPKLRSYLHTGIPQHLSKKETKQLLKSAADGTAMATRNVAILMLLSTFGLRGAEVADLELEDVDWSKGEIQIRTSKTHKGRSLPLVKNVAVALLNYLRNGRPPTMHRKLFIQYLAPFRPVSATSISKMVSRQLLKAGIQSKKGGSHILRHSVATQLVNNGASFKDIADLLGHRSIESTAIYAKVDLNSLAKIGLPWPGGKQQ